MRGCTRLAFDVLHRPAQTSLPRAGTRRSRPHALRQARSGTSRSRTGSSHAATPARLTCATLGTGTYFHSATPHTGLTATTSWSGSRPSPGRTAASAPSALRRNGCRSARRSNAVTAIWPDVVTTNNYANCAREGGAMKWARCWGALHPCAGRSGHPRRPGQAAGRLERLRDLRRLYRRLRGHARPGPRADARRLCHPRLRRVVGAERVRLHGPLRPARRRPRDRLRVVRPVGRPRRRLLGGDERAERFAPAARARAVGPTSHARGGDPRHEVDFGPESVWGWSATSRSNSTASSRWLPDDAEGDTDGEAPIRIFVMGGGSVTTSRRPLARGVGMAARASGGDDLSLGTANGVLSETEPAADVEPLRYAACPLIGGSYCAVRRAARRGCRHGVGALSAPGAAACATCSSPARPTSAERRNSSARRSPIRGSRSAWDVLVFRTEPLAEPVDGDRPVGRAPVDLVERARHARRS